MRQCSCVRAKVMRVDWNEKICGVPVIRIRDLLRYLGHDQFSQDFVADDLKLNSDEAKTLVEDLLKRGLIESARGPAFGIFHGSMESERYQVTMAGNALANARAVKRINRKRADELLVSFIDRVKAINADDAYGYYVPEVQVFGSYLDSEAKDLGDIDIALDLALRPIIGRDIVKYSHSRASQSGRSLPGFLDRIGYAETEVRSILKNRSPYISMHPLSDLKATGATAKQVFAASAKDARPRPYKPK